MRRRAIKIQFNLFLGGRSMALALSYDDGCAQDRRLVALLNEAGIKSTFHLNSSTLDTPNHIASAEVELLYRGHEVAAHTYAHPFLPQMPILAQQQEILQDRVTLETLCGVPVTGMSWPFGVYHGETITMAKHCGIAYSRTTNATGEFLLPESWLQWHPTAHHSEALDSLWKRFLDAHREDMRLLFLWGHSYEFETEQQWNRMRSFCQTAGKHSGVWRATYIEIQRYISALHGLVFNAKCSQVYNPSALEVWFSADRVTVCVGKASQKH